jgi:oligoendopeptidase F
MICKSLTNTLSIYAMTALIIMAMSLAAFGEVKEAPTRDQIEDQYKWNLTDFYETDEAWEEAFAGLEERSAEIESFKGKLGESAETLLKSLALNDTLGMIGHRLWVYARLSYDLDQREAKYNEMNMRVWDLYGRLGEISAYISPEIIEIGKETIDSFLDSSEDLELYRFYFEDLFRSQEYILSEPEERILSLAAPIMRNPSDIFRQIDNADITFPNVKDDEGNEIELTRGRFSQLLESKNREVRKEAYDAYNDTYLKYQNGLGAALASSIKGDLFISRARGYNSCLEMSLDGNNIPESVFRNLIDVASSNLEPLHKYMSIKKRYLGVDTLMPYDTYVPMVEEIDLEVPYEKAKELARDALKIFGNEYMETIDMALNSRWIDVYETKGKETGGYNWGTYTVHPVILLNYDNTMRSAFTLAHELGHTMHGWYSYNSEPYVYAGHSLFTAEVASICNEFILINYMMENAKTKEEKLYLVNRYLQRIQGAFFTQIYFSEFEDRIHKILEEGGALSTETLRKNYREVYEKYYGPDYFIPEDRDLGSIRISHFYRQFYVYQYATGVAAAQLIANKISSGDEKAKEAWIEFLKTGSSAYPIDILKKAGVDMTTREPFENIINVFSGLVDQLEELLFEEG